MLNSYLQWNELAWSKALPLFERITREFKITTGLEIAANRGGMSLFFANELNVKMICSDLKNPELYCDTTVLLLKNKNMIDFMALDGLNMKLEDNSIEMLVFKSYLGGLHTWENQLQAMNEIYRVLKPGGILFLAENLKGSVLHIAVRKLFVSWSKRWRYITLSEMNTLLAKFESTELCTFGFFSAFYKVKTLSGFFYSLDRIFNNYITPGNKYICYGYALKPLTRSQP